MQELITGITGLAGLIEKGGIIGVLLIGIAVLVYERQQRVKELMKTYRQRDKARLISVRYKSALDSRDIKVETSDIEAMFGVDGAGGDGGS